MAALFLVLSFPLPPLSSLAYAGIHVWIPACAGMTELNAGMTDFYASA